MSAVNDPNGGMLTKLVEAQRGMSDAEVAVFLATGVYPDLSVPPPDVSSLAGSDDDVVMSDDEARAWLSGMTASGGGDENFFVDKSHSVISTGETIAFDFDKNQPRDKHGRWTDGAPGVATLKAKVGIKAGKQITPAKIYKTHNDGDVVAVSSAGDRRMRWNATQKKFITERVASDGSWQHESSLGKSAAYADAKAGVWYEPTADIPKPRVPGASIGQTDQNGTKLRPSTPPQTPESTPAVVEPTVTPEPSPPQPADTQLTSMTKTPVSPTKAIYGAGIANGSVVAENSTGSQRLRWDAGQKKFVLETRGADGSWATSESLTKKNAYDRVKSGGWFSPTNTSSNPSPTPTVTSPTPQAPQTPTPAIPQVTAETIASTSKYKPGKDLTSELGINPSIAIGKPYVYPADITAQDAVSEVTGAISSDMWKLLPDADKKLLIAKVDEAEDKGLPNSFKAFARLQALKSGKEVTATTTSSYLAKISTEELAGLKPQEGGDTMLAAITKMQPGWHDLPDVVSPNEMDSAVANGWTEIWRGVSGPDAVALTESVRSGQWWMGFGTYGNGVYASARKTAGLQFTGTVPVGDTSDPKMWSDAGEWLGEFDGPKTPPSLLRMAIDPSARIIDHDDLIKERFAWKKELESQGKAMDPVWDDLGRFAAMRGYDAIRTYTTFDGAKHPPNAEPKPTYTLLNRSMLKVEAATPSAIKTPSTPPEVLAAANVAMKRVSNAFGVDLPPGAITNEPGSPASTNQTTGEVLFNPAEVERLNTFRKEKMNIGGVLGLDIDVWTEAGVHEGSHLLAHKYLSGDEQVDALRAGAKSAGIPEPSSDDYIGSTYGWAASLEQKTLVGYKPGTGLVSQNISPYAAFNSHEALAEALAEYVLSDNPRPFAKGVGDYVKGRLKGVGTLTSPVTDETNTSTSDYIGPSVSIPDAVTDDLVNEFLSLAAKAERNNIQFSAPSLTPQENMKMYDLGVKIGKLSDQSIRERFAQLGKISASLEIWKDDHNLTNVNTDDLKKQLAAETRTAFAGKKIGVRVNEKTLTGILSDGRIKTQFETNTSMGHNDPKFRAMFESRWFGIGQGLSPEDAAKVEPEKRPIYGYVMVDGIRSSGPTHQDILSWYGDIQVVLKNDVRQRTTAMFGDSINEQKYGMPSPVDNPSWESFSPMGYGGQHPLAQRNRDTSSSQFRASTYAEAQIHGGVTTDDIEEIIFSSQPSDEMLAALEKSGISWRILPAGE